MESKYSLCRLCLMKIENGGKSLFESYIETVPTIEIATKVCYKIHMQIGDRFPEYICNECFNILENAHMLCERSIQSEKQLMLMITSVSIKEELQFDGDEVFESKLNICNIVSNDISIANVVEDEIEKKIEFDDDEQEQEQEEIDEADPNYDETLQINLKKVTKKHKCSVCDKMFDKPSKLLRHEKTHDANKKPFACEEADCFQRFQTLASLQRHQIIHSGMTIKIAPDNRNWPCVICAKEFESQESMASHMRCHKDEMEKLEFPCNLCTKVFKKLNELTRHLRTHKENKNYKCQICNKLFSQGSHLIDHLNRHKGLKPHTCNICNKSFQQSSTLKDHLRTHSSDKPFLCSTCGKSFNNPSNLRQHVKRHQNLKEFACELCPSKFSCKASLQSHIRSHNGIKNHTCQTCGSSFTKGSSLKKHIRSIHEGIKDYQCSTCSMRFTSSEHLKRHYRTHSGEKPYRCHICDKAYSQSNDLLKHKKIHIGENVYKCTYENCNEAFRLKSLLRDHYIVHKRITDEEKSQ